MDHSPRNSAAESSAPIAAFEAAPLPTVPLPNRGIGGVVGVLSDYALPGVRWSYYNTVHQFLDLAHDWPAGLAAHFAWQDDGQWRSVFLWRSDDVAEHFFATVAAEAVSRAINLLGAVPGPTGATDVEAERSPVRDFVVGPFARKFCDIGEDRDGTAIGVLGGRPVVIELIVEGLNAADLRAAWSRLGYDREVPRDLIALAAAEREDDWQLLELWSSRAHGLAALGGAQLPVLECLARERGKELPTEHRVHEAQRIMCGEAAVRAFGF